MFKKPTAIILGAGASHECDLPLGGALRDTIASALGFRFEMGGLLGHGEQRLYDLLVHQYKDYKKIFEISNQVATTARNFPSIDEVLHYFRNEPLAIEFGKLAIVYSILSAEGNSKLAIDRETGEANLEGLNGTWYDLLFSIAISGLQKEEMDQIFDNVTFINFNYDRTLESFLFNTLVKSAGIGTALAAEIVAKVNIIRPYGSLGPIDWRLSGVHIGGSPDRTLFDRAKGIRTFTEAHEKKIKDQIDSALNRSRLLICLGFGFHAQNIELLSPSTSDMAEERGRLNRPVFATMKGIHGKNIPMIQSALSQAFKTGDHVLVNMTAAEMLAELRPSISTAAR